MKICTIKHKIGIDPTWLAFSHIIRINLDAEKGLDAYANELLTFQATKENGENTAKQTSMVTAEDAQSQMSKRSAILVTDVSSEEILKYLDKRQISGCFTRCYSIITWK
jgi:hypothetical protein